MTSKESIQNLLNDLENEGMARSAVEQELDYSENSITQLLSRGGNDKFKRVLEILLRKTILEKRIKILESANPLHEVSSKMKKHIDLLLEQAGIMRKMIEENINSGDGQHTDQNPPAIQDESKKKLSRFDRQFADKSKAQVRRGGRGKKKDKGI